MASNLRVKTEKFRAVNEADIIIDGITLVAGENGCGKSTLSKLLYFLFKTVSDFDVLVKQNLTHSLRDILRFLEIFQQEVVYSQKDRKIRDDFRKEIEDLRRSMFYNEFLNEEVDKWMSLIDKVEYLYVNHVHNSDHLFKNETSVGSRTHRMNRILKEVLREDFQASDYREIFQKVKVLVRDKFKEAKGKIDSRPTSIFVEELQNAFNDSKLPKKFEVYEFEDIIVSLDRSYLSIAFSVDKAIYIDTPMMISIADSHNEYWDDLNALLLENNDQGVSNSITDIISGQIIKGDVESDDGIFLADDFKFKRIDGAIFSLLDVATGIKAFSILQLLLKNGHLDENTLLVIDEPESNLHPQWIIEYARVIVLLNKHLGVKFFLASHNPDMVSAIRYISEKEGVLDAVNFYLAEREENNFVYNYKYLSKNIDPIFESFNIAISRINQYGV